MKQYWIKPLVQSLLNVVHQFYLTGPLSDWTGFKVFKNKIFTQHDAGLPTTPTYDAVRL